MHGTGRASGARVRAVSQSNRVWQSVSNNLRMSDKRLTVNQPRVTINGRRALRPETHFNRLKCVGNVGQFYSERGSGREQHPQFISFHKFAFSALRKKEHETKLKRQWGRRLLRWFSEIQVGSIDVCILTDTRVNTILRTYNSGLVPSHVHTCDMTSTFLLWI